MHSNCILWVCISLFWYIIWCVILFSWFFSRQIHRFNIGTRKHILLSKLLLKIYTVNKKYYNRYSECCQNKYSQNITSTANFENTFFYTKKTAANQNVPKKGTHFVAHELGLRQEAPHEGKAPSGQCSCPSDFFTNKKCEVSNNPSK